MNTTWYLHSHFAWLRLSASSIVKLPFVCVVAHESGVSSMDDRRICQTSTATPAEPGDLLWEVRIAAPVGAAVPHCPEFIIGRRFAPTRWLQAGYRETR